MAIMLLIFTKWFLWFFLSNNYLSHCVTHINSGWNFEILPSTLLCSIIIIIVYLINIDISVFLYSIWILNDWSLFNAKVIKDIHSLPIEMPTCIDFNYIEFKIVLHAKAGPSCTKIQICKVQTLESSYRSVCMLALCYSNINIRIKRFSVTKWLNVQIKRNNYYLVTRSWIF